MKTCHRTPSPLNLGSIAILLAGLWLLTLTSCITRIEEADIGEDWYAFIDSREGVKTRLNQLSASDGISIQEACFLSTLYFQRYNGMCGASFIAGHTKNQWIFEAMVGSNGVSAPPIKVNKRTGQIRQKGQPESAAPWSDLMEWLKIGYSIETKKISP